MRKWMQSRRFIAYALGVWTTGAAFFSYYLIDDMFETKTIFFQEMIVFSEACILMVVVLYTLYLWLQAYIQLSKRNGH